MYPVLPHVLQDRPGPFVQARTAPLADEHFSPSKSDRNDPSRRMRARRRANRAYYSLFEANPESYPHYYYPRSMSGGYKSEAKAYRLRLVA